jgi:hypothetical protein
MTRMRIERYRSRRQLPRWAWGCGCGLILAGGLAVVVLVALLVLPSLPGIGLQLAGFESAGTTEQVFANRPAPAPQPQIQNAAPAGGVSVSAGSYGSIDVNAVGVQVETGTGGDGNPIAVVSLTEAEVNELCRQRTTLCSAGGNGQIRNARIDLRPGGAIVFADFNVPQLGVWQYAGVVLTLDTERVRFNVAGIDMNGTLYRAPPEGLGVYIDQVESTANDVLRQIALQASGETFRPNAIYADNDRITMYLQR